MPNPPLAASTEPLTERLAAHLLRRSTYNFNIDRIKAFTGLTPHQAVEELFDFSNPTRYSSGPLDWNEGSSQTIYQLGNTNYTSPSNFSANLRGRATILWSIYDALYDSTSRWKVMHWLHSIFTVRTNPYFFHYWKLLEACVETDLKTLAIKMTTDNCMMTYLDNGTNTKDAFNENFAREVLELMTIRKGASTGLGSYTNYTETDIANAAKVLSGYVIDPIWNPPPDSPFNDITDTGIASSQPNPDLHDFTAKVFSPELTGGNPLSTISATDNSTLTDDQAKDRMYEELNEFYTIVYNNEETARSFVRRMYQFFVRDEIDVFTESEIIVPLAQDLINEGTPGYKYDHIFVLKKLLKSNHFYDLDDAHNNNDIIGGKIKSPWELLYQSINLLNIAELPDPADPDTSNEDLELQFKDYYFIVGEEHLRFIGLNPRGPDTVEGYPGFYDEPKFSKNWFSSSNLYRRYTLGESFKGNYQYVHANANASSFSQPFPFTIDLFDFVLQFEEPGSPGTPTDPKGVANAETLVTGIVSGFLPETPTPASIDWYLAGEGNIAWSTDRYNYFKDALLGGLSPINWYFSWTAYVAADPTDLNYDEIRNNVQVALERLFDAILSSPEFQTF